MIKDYWKAIRQVYRKHKARAVLAHLGYLKDKMWKDLYVDIPEEYRPASYYEHYLEIHRGVEYYKLDAKAKIND